ncbi:MULTISPECIES: type I-F CRISPR-associated endoribonuclease Cas6/Csy4 [Psychrobacter]|uniref:type I-F CRISPR-associated endoribonuclease Cas6/Csy4 n=1 Tax=Psychrobacter TaxID=497 RepID=UPI001D0D71BA|nr:MULTISPECIES: type I-F CRISPR-associated endoribonuclease Cas6/Csy4 [Psychrobacter]
MTDSTSSLTHFQEITIIPDPDIAPYFIWSKLFTQFHIALAEMKNKHDIESIGVSFPDYHYDDKNEKSSKLGVKLRVFAPNQKDLETLNLDNWLSRLTDYVHIKGIKDVPIDKITGYVSVHRYRFKPIEVQVESLAKKMEISNDEAMAIVVKRKAELKLPFIRMFSESNKTHYPLQILQQPSKQDVTGGFNVYGMNGMRDNVTVPQW